jgi:Amt family ammonium transporter
MAHIVWHPRGFFKTNDIEDFSGGIVVHMTAGVTIVAAHLFLDWIKAPPAEQRQPNNPEGILFSAFLVWFLWFGINAGKAYGASFVASQSIVNTIAAVFTSVLLNYFFDQVASVPVTNISLVNGILLGLISTSPSSGYVTVGGSMVVTVITVIVTRFFGKVIRKEALNDNAYSLATLHGVGGSVSFLFTALISYNFINPSGALNGLTYGVDTPIRNHTAAILAVWSCGFLAVLLALFLSNLVVPISKTAQPKGEFYPTALGPLGHGNNDSADYNSTANYNVGKLV